MLPLPRGAIWQLLFLFCAALYINGVRSEGRVVCYYTNWSVYRPGTAKFNPQNINPYLCTHLIYAFGGFTKDNQMKPFDKYQDIEQGGYAKFTGLKTYNKQLKTMIAIGGWNEASSRFSPLVANSERRQKFIKNILKFLRQNHFDGIDLDWEYPAHREGGKAHDRDNYAQFVQELRAEFEREAEKTGRSRLLVTMAVPAGIEYIEKGYDIPKLNKYLDWFNVLTYDFHSSHEPSVNHHAPLYSLEEESEYNYDAELNIDYSIKFYLNAGADKDKLVLGIPTYGRSFTLINEESTEIGAPAEAPGEQGDATREKGYLAYYEICQNLKEDPEWTVVQPNPNAMGPYAYRRTQWVGYDDEAIVRKKAQYVVDNGLGGIMFWAIDNDDFRGTCTGKPYPLIEAAKDAMLEALGLGINEVSKPSAPQKPSRSRSRENVSSTRNRITTSEHKLTYAERKGSNKRTQTTQQNTRTVQPSTTNAPVSIKLTEAEGSSLYIGGRTTTPPPPTTPDPGTDFKCEEEGFFQHPRDCKKYYWCLDSGPSGLGIVAHQFTCPSGLYFNPAADSCDFARNVPCKTKKSTTAAPVTTYSTTTTITPRPTQSVNRITAATSRTSFFRTTSTTSTTTTTEAPEEEIEYEEDEESGSSPFAKHKGPIDKEAEEDPQVIKELIELIRKVGGIEELEKHLLRKDDGTISIKENSSSSIAATTASPISKSLYEKVLSKPNALSSFRNRFTSTSTFRNTKTKTEIKAQDETVEEQESDKIDLKSSGATSGYSKYSSVVRGNSRQGPQSEGIEKSNEFDGLYKGKKQYITINRGNKKAANAEGEDESVIAKSHIESTENDEEEEEVIVKTTKRPLSSNTPSYSTIRRTRPPTITDAEEEEEEDEVKQEEKEVTDKKSYSSINRSRSRGTTTTEVPDVTEVTAGATRYKYLERTRPTRPTTEASNKISNEDDRYDEHLEDHENTVLLKDNENTRETQQEIITNTQRAYASIGRRTTTSTATSETETTTIAAKVATTTTATPTTSTTETPITTPLTNLETTTPESILITTTNSNIPITTTTNPTTISSTTTSTTTTTLPNGEEVLDSLYTTPYPNEIDTDSETLNLSLNINSLLTETVSTTSSPTTTESGLDTKKPENDILETTTTTTETTVSTTTEGNDIVPKTEDLEVKQQQNTNDEVTLVNKQRNKTLYTTRIRTTTETPSTRTTTTNSVIETTSSPTINTNNNKKTFGVRRQQLLLNRSSQTKTTTDISSPTTESVNNDFLGTVSSPRPFGFPKRRTRPTTTSASVSTTTIEEIVKPNEETLVTKQKTTKLNAAVTTQTKKYQFQRRTTTTTTTTTENPVESNEDHDEEEVVTKAQVNENDSETSTNISETSAPTTESPSSPATPLARRIKVLKLKRPIVSNNTTALASSATNFNASHTETQNIDKLSSVSEVEEHLVKTHTLTEIETQTEIPSQTPPTPKRFRKVIRKLIRPVNRTAEIPNEEKSGETNIDNNFSPSTTSTPTSTFLQRRQNATRFGFNRSSKFSLSSQNSNNANDDEEKTETIKDEDLTQERTPSAIYNRGRNKFTLSSAVTSSTRSSLYSNTNRNRFANRQQSSTTTEGSKTSEEEETEDDEEEDEEEDEVSSEEEVKEITPLKESKVTGDSIYTSTNRFRFSKPSTTTETIVESNEEDNTEDTTVPELETTTLVEDKDSISSTLVDLQNLRNKIKIDSFKQQDLGVLSDRFKTTTSEIEEQQTDDPLLKLRNKVKQDLAKGTQEEGVLSDRFKTKSDNEEQQTDDPLLKLRNKVKQDLAKGTQEEGVLSDRFKTKLDNEEQQTDDPLLKLRNKVKQDLAKGTQEEGVLSDRFKTKSDNEVQQTDDPLLKLRNKVKQDLAKGNQEEGVVSSKLKKLLETKTNSSTLSYAVDGTKNDSEETQDSLNLQKIRDKVQNNLVKGDQDQGVVNSRLKKLLSERSHSKQTDINTVEDESTTEVKESSGEDDLVETSKSLPSRKPFTPRTKITQVNDEDSSQSNELQESSTSTPKEKPTFRRKLIAKRPYIPTKPSISVLATSTIKIPTTKVKNKYVRRKFGRYHPFNASNRNTGEGFVRKDPRGNILPGADRFRVEGSAGGQNGEGEDYEEYDEESENEDGEEEEEEGIKPAQPESPILPVKPVITRPPGLFNRPQSNILKKPTSKEQNSEDNDSDEEEEEEEDDNEEEDQVEEVKNESAEKQNEIPVVNRPNYKPKANRIPPGARPSLSSTTSNKPFTPSRFANRPGGSTPTTTPNYSGNRFGSAARSTAKPRVVNRPLGVVAPNLTLKPIAKDFERTTVLIPTKPAPFINTNTRAYERKYTGPSTEASIVQDNDTNPLIEDLNIEALNARNKKIFDIHSKKHTPLKQKVLIPFGNLNENTQQQQQQINTANENDEGYQSSLNGFATTTITTPLATQDNTIIGTQNTEDENLSNAINLNEISSQDASTTTSPPSTTLLHIFTLSDDEHTTKNPLEDDNLVVTRHGEKAKPKHKVVEINRIVEVNSKEEKIRRKSKANTITAVEGSQTYRVESLPHVEQLGEISVVKYVHQVDGSDITIEGRSTVTDYTPTEPTLPKVSQPIRNTYPEGNVEAMEERYGKALIPEVLREAVETSTISLEGLFEHARQGKVLNTIDDVTFAQQQDINANSFKTQESESSKLQIETSTEKLKDLNIESFTESSANREIVSSTERFNILKTVAFDIAKINLEPNSPELEESKKSSDSLSTTSTTSQSSSSTSSITKEAVLTTTMAPETLNVESSTVASEEMKATTVAAALFPQYVRPIVPLLRPESNESSPLVISIANLDKVILSKVRKSQNGEVLEEEEQEEEQQVNHNIIPNPNTETPETITNTNNIPKNNQIPETLVSHTPDIINDSNGEFSSRLASVVKAPHLNSFHQEEKQKVNPLDMAKEMPQTVLYTINEGPSVASTTSSTIGSKISEIVSFSSETTVVRQKHARNSKSRKFKSEQKNIDRFISATIPTTDLVSES